MAERLGSGTTTMLCKNAIQREHKNRPEPLLTWLGSSIQGSTKSSQDSRPKSPQALEKPQHHLATISGLSIHKSSSNQRIKDQFHALQEEEEETSLNKDAETRSNEREGKSVSRKENPRE